MCWAQKTGSRLCKRVYSSHIRFHSLIFYLRPLSRYPYPEVLALAPTSRLREKQESSLHSNLEVLRATIFTTRPLPLFRLQNRPPSIEFEFLAGQIYTQSDKNASHQDATWRVAWPDPDVTRMFFVVVVNQFENWAVSPNKRVIQGVFQIPYY